MTKLIQLPNGRWIRPDLVAFIVGPALEAPEAQTVRIDFVGVANPLLFKFDNARDAIKFRDDCAALVNGTACKKPFTKVTDLPRNETLKETNDRLIREGKVDAR